MRIMSLLPSATEIVCALGLGDQLVGVTHECDYPPSVTKLPRVTQTLIPTQASSQEIDTLVREQLTTQRALYTLNQSLVEELKPELIVTQALCDVCAVAAAEVNATACRLPGSPPVINLEPTSLADVFACIQAVAEVANCPERGAALIAAGQSRLAQVRERNRALTRRPRVVLLEWLAPPFSCGHWSPELVSLAGGDEQIGRVGDRSRTLTWDEVCQADPEVLIIACCGFDVPRTCVDLPLLGQVPGFADLTCTRQSRIYVIDGNAYFSRPGPRLIESVELLAHTLHPELHPLPDGLSPAYKVTRQELGG